MKNSKKLTIYFIFILVISALIVFLVIRLRKNKYVIINGTEAVYGNPKSVVKKTYEVNYKFDEFQRNALPLKIEYYFFDNKSNLIKEKFISSLKSTETNYTYDENNSLIRKTNTENNQLKWYSEYLYSNGVLIEEKTLSNKSVLEKINYQYNTSDRKRKEFHFRDNISQITISDFDQKGNLIETVYYDTLGNRQNSINFSYDENGLLRRRGTNGYLTEVEYEYNPSKLLISTKWSIEKDIFSYKEFDRLKNWKIREEFVDLSGTHIRYLTDREISYY